MKTRTMIAVERQIKEAERRIEEGLRPYLYSDLIKLPRFKEPIVTREVISSGNGLFKRLWCRLFGHERRTMVGKEPKLRMEVCQRCGQVTQAEGGWEPLVSIEELIAANPMATAVHQFVKRMQDQLYGNSFVTVSYKKRDGA